MTSRFKCFNVDLLGRGFKSFSRAVSSAGGPELHLPDQRMLSQLITTVEQETYKLQQPLRCSQQGMTRVTSSPLSSATASRRGREVPSRWARAVEGLGTAGSRTCPCGDLTFIVSSTLGELAFLGAPCALSMWGALTEKTCVNFCLTSQGFYSYKQVCVNFPALVFSQMIGFRPTGCSGVRCFGFHGIVRVEIAAPLPERRSELSFHCPPLLTTHPNPGSSLWRLCPFGCLQKPSAASLHTLNVLEIIPSLFVPLEISWLCIQNFVKVYSAFLYGVCVLKPVTLPKTQVPYTSQLSIFPRHCNYHKERTHVSVWTSSPLVSKGSINVFLIIFLSYSIVDLQWCVHFCYTAK